MDSHDNRGTFDKYGNVVFPCLYYYYDETCVSGIYMVNNGRGQYGYYDLPNRKEIIPCIYSPYINKN